ncbi:type II toxin-antitoxin system RatA family toxin [Streptomyces sp. NPDC058291]|uniref:type II toxin-antitoxin system RatA family toxin n=1 Tax=Streptomyces sp. NPDC058291 TaxID=3346427 RepID=UPI0036E633E6
MHVLHTTAMGSGSPEAVWKVLVDCEAFPGFLEGVQEVTVTGRDEDRRTAEWVVELKGSEMEWEQEDVLEPAERRLTFRQTEGDLAHYEGYWQVVEEAGGVGLELKVEFDVGLPMLADMIHPAVAKALESYQQEIVQRSR